MELRLTTAERDQLTWMANNLKDPKLQRRATALLEADAGSSPSWLAARYGVARATIYNWIRHYRAFGPGEAGLRDRPRPGRPRRARPGGGDQPDGGTPPPTRTGGLS